MLTESVMTFLDSPLGGFLICAGLVLIAVGAFAAEVWFDARTDPRRRR